MATMALRGMHYSHTSLRRPQRWDQWAGALALAVAVSVLLGWALDIRALRSFFPQFIDMKLSTAVCIAALGLAILLFRGTAGAVRCSITLAWLVLLTGAITLVEYAVGPELLITDWTFKDGRVFLEFKERLAPVTAIAFCFAGTGLLLLRRSSWVPLAQLLIALAGELGLVTVTAYLYGASSFYGDVPEHQMALTTALGLISAAVGGVFLRPNLGLMRVFMDRDAGGHMARQLLPAAILVPILLGWMRLQAELAGLFNTHTATAMYALACVTTFGLLIYRCAGDLSLFDRKRRRAENKLRRHQQRLEEEVQQRTSALQTSETRFRRVTELMTDVVMETGLVSGEIEWCGPIDEIMGFADSTFPRSTAGFLEHIHSDDRAVVARMLGGALELGQPLEASFRVLRADGAPVHFSVQAVTLNDDTQSPLLLLALSNVTATKRAEDQGRKLEHQMRQMQKMEAIGTLAGGIAHDFNNILAAIVGYGAMVRSTLPEGSQARENQDEVLTAAKRATELVRQILTLSRHNLTSRVPVSVKGIIHEVAKLMRASLPSTIEIKLRINAAQTTVLADPIQLHQVLMNLCTNAGHAMAELGGTLELRVRPHEVTALGADSLLNGQYLLISVSDTGVGIPSELLDRIFEPFFTTKDVGVGTGLGLSTAHAIATDLGGRLSVYSELGVGTTFHLYLPLVESAVHDEVAVQVLRGSERILFVDDEEALSRMGKLLLEEYGYQVEAFSSSIQALRAFSEHPTAYDLVITDQTMPRMKGIDLAARIAQINPAVPVILCTGFGLQERDQSVKAIREVLIKPVDRAELTQAIRRTLAAAGPAIP
jgi:signal transduction histidine kinase/ActR/RegA family two-component response regulator